MRNRSWQFFKQAAVAGFSVVVFLTLGSSAHANLLNNPTFTTPSINGSTTFGTDFCNPNGSSTCTSLIPGWSSACNVASSSDTCQLTDPVLDVLYPSSAGAAAFNDNIGLTGISLPTPFSGNLVAADGDSTYSQPFQQTIGGLSVGASYSLTFWQAASQQSGGSPPTTEQWQVSLGSQTLTSALMSNTGTPVDYTSWTSQTLSFTASSSSEVLSFLALGTPSGVPPIALLGGVNLTMTPEPSYYGALGLGMAVLFGFVARRRRSRA